MTNGNITTTQYDYRIITTKNQTKKKTTCEFKLEKVSNIDRHVFNTVTKVINLPTDMVNDMILGNIDITTFNKGTRYFPQAPL